MARLVLINPSTARSWGDLSGLVCLSSCSIVLAMGELICYEDYCQEAYLQEQTEAPVSVGASEETAKYDGVGRRYQFAGYSTVTDLARFLGWSTLQPRLTAT